MSTIFQRIKSNADLSLLLSEPEGDGRGERSIDHELAKHEHADAVEKVELSAALDDELGARLDEYVAIHRDSGAAWMPSQVCITPECHRAAVYLARVRPVFEYLLQKIPSRSKRERESGRAIFIVCLFLYFYSLICLVLYKNIMTKNNKQTVAN